MNEIRNDQMVEAHDELQPKPTPPAGDPLAIPEFLDRTKKQEKTVEDETKDA